MKRAAFAFVVTILIGVLVLAQQTLPAGGQAQGGSGGRGGGQTGPAIANLSLRPTGSSLGTIRVGAADNKIWFGWHVAIPASDFHQLTFSEAITKASQTKLLLQAAPEFQLLRPRPRACNQPDGLLGQWISGATSRQPQNLLLDCGCQPDQLHYLAQA